jgi:hypothetical protein
MSSSVNWLFDVEIVDNDFNSDFSGVEAILNSVDNNYMYIKHPLIIEAYYRFTQVQYLYSHYEFCLQKIINKSIV